MMRSLLAEMRVAAGLAFALPLSTTSVTAEDAHGVPFEPRSGPRGARLFSPVEPARSGIVTENNYADAKPSSSGYKDPRMWADRYHEFEVGAVGTGVAIGDFDGDGRSDIFVVSKTETCRLFRNLGDWKFQDVTERAGVGDTGEAAMIWKQGASFADVNNDGRLDLYVCRFGAPNLLYINQGDGTFREEAAARGLAVSDASVMGAFCDYDRDGWLDVFVQTNLLNGTEHPSGQRDYLFHNNGDGTFTPVTDRAGIRGETQGHSATWWDFDEDGWPDLYVANDFAPADNLYHNNRDGTFTDVIHQTVPRLPFSSMGSDLGDVNNDGHLDLFVADMAATSHQKDQRGMANLRVQMQEESEDAKLAPQVVHNVLFLNSGRGRMMDAAFLSGVAATDWTWAVRLEDLDNDGRVDLYVTNGMHREVHNADQIQRLLLADSAGEKLRIEKSSPVLAEANLAFRNLGDLAFENVSDAWGLGEKGVSFGAAFGDLDGDGDLDLVYTNYRKGVTVLRNDSDGGHRVVFALQGRRSNRLGVGATIRIETSAGIQVRQLVLARGVLSSSEPTVHFGLGEVERIERVIVNWPSGEVQTLRDLPGDRKFLLVEPETGARPSLASGPPLQFVEVSAELKLNEFRPEAKLDETSQQPLLPLRQNRRGPAIAVGDLDGDGKDDIVVGGTSLKPSSVMLSRDAGYEARETFPASALNDGPVLIFDANGDGQDDVLRTRSGVALPVGAADYQPQLWLGSGADQLVLKPDALPPLLVSAGAAVAADWNRDGRLDVFVGGRVVPGAYPQSPRSFLLQNRGDVFLDVTDQVPGLAQVGMVTSALATDVDNDGWLDLLVATEWGGVQCFRNDSGQGWIDVSDRMGFSAAGRGWWTSLAAADFNRDGQLDYVVGNLGLNTPYQADESHPAVLYVGDFKGDGTEQLIEGYYEGERLYPRRTRKELGAVLPSILKRYARNDAFARATLAEVVGEAALAKAQKFIATEFRSGIFLRQPDGRFAFQPLPRIAQLAPMQGIAAGDFDGDGRADVYAVQNSYSPVPAIGRFDGGLSVFLRGDGHGGFSLASWAETGLVVTGDAKGLAVLDLNDDQWPDFVVTRNNDSALAFRNRPMAGREYLKVRLRGAKGNLEAIGARVTVTFSDDSSSVSEVTAGGGYLSQSSTALFFGHLSVQTPRAVTIRWPSGATSRLDVAADTKTLTVTIPEK